MTTPFSKNSMCHGPTPSHVSPDFHIEVSNKRGLGANLNYKLDSLTRSEEKSTVQLPKVNGALPSGKNNYIIANHMDSTSATSLSISKSQTFLSSNL
jgi:hypothetical protein